MTMQRTMSYVGYATAFAALAIGLYLAIPVLYKAWQHIELKVEVKGLTTPTTTTTAPVTPAATSERPAPVLTPNMSAKQALALWNTAPWTVAPCHKITRAMPNKTTQMLVVVGLHEKRCPVNPNINQVPCDSGVVLAEKIGGGDPMTQVIDWRPACLRAG